MKPIYKGSEPKRLAEYRKRPNAVYDGPHFTQVKDALRTSLLKEQGALCAFCMNRIERRHMKIEHWHSQSGYPQEQLDYLNLLGCCEGHDKNANVQYCGTSQGARDIACNPANANHHVRMQIRYARDGVVRSEDSEFNRQLNEVLNLNWRRLTENRKEVYDLVISQLERNRGTRSRPEIQTLLRRWELLGPNGELPAFCGVAIYLLRKKLAKMK